MEHDPEDRKKANVLYRVRRGCAVFGKTSSAATPPTDPARTSVRALEEGQPFYQEKVANTSRAWRTGPSARSRSDLSPDPTRSATSILGAEARRLSVSTFGYRTPGATTTARRFAFRRHVPEPLRGRCGRSLKVTVAADSRGGTSCNLVELTS